MPELDKLNYLMVDYLANLKNMTVNSKIKGPQILE